MKLVYTVGEYLDSKLFMNNDNICSFKVSTSLVCHYRTVLASTTVVIISDIKKRVKRGGGRGPPLKI